jgi:hypothetical protein
MERLGSITISRAYWGQERAAFVMSENALSWLLPFLLGLPVAYASYQGWAIVAFALVIAGLCFCFFLARPEFGICLFLTTMLLTNPDVLQGVGLLTPNNVLGLVFSGLLLTRLYANRDLWFVREKELWILLLLFIWFLLSTGASEFTLPHLRFSLIVDKRVAGRDLTFLEFKNFVSRVAFVIFFVNFITTRRHIKLFLFVFLSCIVIALPFAGYNFLHNGGADARVTAGKDFIGGGSDWLSNEPRFAFMCLVSALLQLYFAAISRNTLIRLCTVPGICLSLGMIILSGSRSGFLMVGLSGAWLFFRSRNLKLQTRLMLVSAGAVVAVIFFLLLPPLTQQRLLNLNPFHPQGEGTHSTEVRVATIEESLAIFARYPLFGVGLGNFRWINTYFHGNFKPPHNSYLWALAEGGVFCLLFYFFLFYCMQTRLRMLREKFRSDPELPWIGDVVSFYFYVFLFFSLFADIWLDEIHLYILLGLILSLTHLPQETPIAQEMKSYNLSFLSRHNRG